jgi:serine/threonine protein kinase
MELTRRRKRIHRRHHSQLGGIPVFAGAQGCVFKPALKCTHQPRNPNDGNISKLEQKESAESEMREYDQIRQHLKQIPNYQNYFSMNATLCEPDPLEPHDLVKFDDVCTNMHALNINSANVNANLSKLRMINMPDLGIDLKVWIEQAPFNAGRLRKLNDHVSNLLIRAIAPMNRLGVIHNDLKSENVMIDENNHSRIIDWGLAGVTTPEQVIPARHFMNNPVTFNRPFSTMVISRETCELYSKYLRTATTTTTMTLERMKEFTGAIYKKYTELFDISGFNYMQYTFKSMFGATTPEMLMHTVATYNAEILHHFTDRTRGEFRLNEYFSRVYRYNTDVWGVMSVFYSMFMLPRKSFVMSDAAHADMLRRYRSLFRTVVFARGHERMNVLHIVQHLRQISDAASNAPRSRSKKKRTVRFNLNLNPQSQSRSKSMKRVPTPHPNVGNRGLGMGLGMGMGGNVFYDRMITPKK